jgi:hypothetical protein
MKFLIIFVFYEIIRHYAIKFWYKLISKGQ